MNQSSNKLAQKELLELFNSIKIDKSKDTFVQRSTLLSLLIYHKVDKQYPEYFRYLARTLQNLKKNTISQQQFLKIFLNPNIDLADAFSILDVQKTGSIDLKLFLEVYKASQNYQKLSQQKKRQAEDQIKEAFYSVSEDGKLTPLQFYNIVKFR